MIYDDLNATAPLPKQLLIRRLLELIASSMSQEKKWMPIDFYRNACRLAAAASWAEGAALFLTDSSRKKVFLIASYDESDIKIPGRTFSVGEGVAGAAVLSKKMEYHLPNKPHPAFVPSRSKPEIRALIAAPLMKTPEQVIGVICVHNPIDSDLFEENKIELMEEYASALCDGIMIVRTAESLYDDNLKLRFEAERSSLLFSTAMQFIDGRQLQFILNEMTRSLMRLLKIEYAGIFLHKDDSLFLETSFKIHKESGWKISINSNSKDDPIEVAVRTAWLNKIETKTDINLLKERRMSAHRFADCAALPIIFEEKPIAVFLIMHGIEERQHITEKELILTRAFLSRLAPLLGRIISKE